MSKKKKEKAKQNKGKGKNKYSNFSKVSILLLVLTLLICIMPFSLAETYLPQKQNTNFELIISSPNATSCNYTYIQFPDGTKTTNQYSMTKQGTDYNYTISSGNFSKLGSVCMGVSCYNGAIYESGSVCREVTTQGNNPPDGITIVFFCIGFLICIGFLSYLMIYNIGHFAQMDYDLGDLIKNVSAYFVLLGLFLLSSFYMGNEMINSIMVWIIGITGFTNVGMSFLFFVICFLAKRKTRIENAW